MDEKLEEETAIGSTNLLQPIPAAHWPQLGLKRTAQFKELFSGHKPRKDDGNRVNVGKPVHDSDRCTSGAQYASFAVHQSLRGSWKGDSAAAIALDSRATNSRSGRCRLAAQPASVQRLFAADAGSAFANLSSRIGRPRHSGWRLMSIDGGRGCRRRAKPRSDAPLAFHRVAVSGSHDNGVECAREHNFSTRNPQQGPVLDQLVVVSPDEPCQRPCRREQVFSAAAVGLERQRLLKLFWVISVVLSICRNLQWWDLAARMVRAAVARKNRPHTASIRRSARSLATSALCHGQPALQYWSAASPACLDSPPQLPRRNGWSPLTRKVNRSCPVQRLESTCARVNRSCPAQRAE